MFVMEEHFIDHNVCTKESFFCVNFELSFCNGVESDGTEAVTVFLLKLTASLTVDMEGTKVSAS